MYFIYYIFFRMFSFDAIMSRSCEKLKSLYLHHYKGYVTYLDGLLPITLHDPLTT